VGLFRQALPLMKSLILLSLLALSLADYSRTLFYTDSTCTKAAGAILYQQTGTSCKFQDCVFTDGGYADVDCNVALKPVLPAGGVSFTRRNSGYCSYSTEWEYQVDSNSNNCLAGRKLFYKESNGHFIYQQYSTSTCTGTPTILTAISTCYGGLEGRLNKTNVSTYSVAGYVKNAVDNRAVAQAIVQLKAGAIFTATSGANGLFSFDQVPAGNYSVSVKAANFTDYNGVLAVKGDIAASTSADVSLSPVQTGNGSFRVVLKWGKDPSDLDAHLRAPGCEVYFSSKVCKGANYTAVLDVDARQGYGPETITVTNGLGNDFIYSVKWYAGSGSSWASTEAIVTVYGSMGEVYTFYASQFNGTSGAGSLWAVFIVDATGKISKTY